MNLSTRFLRFLPFFALFLFFAVGLRAEEDFQVLVFSRTAGFRHASIESGVEALEKLGTAHRFGVESSEDPVVFQLENLKRFQVVVFLNTTGDLLDVKQQAAFEAYIRKGGGFVGVHAAADTEYDWEWYGRLVGAYFKSHPKIQEATILVENPSHPATAHLEERWKRRDEWYSFRKNPRKEVQVLLSLDTESFEGGQMGKEHPIAWYHTFEGGRAFYTGLGHTEESYQEEAFLQHLFGGLQWAAGKVDFPASPGKE